MAAPTQARTKFIMLSPPMKMGRDSRQGLAMAYATTWKAPRNRPVMAAAAQAQISGFRRRIRQP